MAYVVAENVFMCHNVYMISEKHSAASRANILKVIESLRKPKVSITCTGCGVEVFLHPCRVARGQKYCTTACRYRHKRGANGANFGNHTGIAGPNNPNWKGGATAERGRNAKECARWRRLVFARDGYVCKDCGAQSRKPKGSKTGSLRAHHIKHWSTHPELRFELSNGVTLCMRCHQNRHPERVVR
jgi:hypothetical protein